MVITKQSNNNNCLNEILIKILLRFKTAMYLKLLVKN